MDVPAALWNAGTRDTVFVPAALCERWAQGFEARAGTPRRATNPKTGGRRPEARSSSQVSPQLFFNTAGAFKPVSLELCTVSAHVVRRPAWFDFDCAVSEVVASLALSCSYSLSLSISRRTSLRLLCPWNSAFVGSNESVGPIAVVSVASLDMDDLYSILSSQRGTRSDSSAPMQGGSLSAFPSLWSFVRRSSHSLWLRVLRHVSCLAAGIPSVPECGISCLDSFVLVLPFRAQTFWSKSLFLRWANFVHFGALKKLKRVPIALIFLHEPNAGAA